MFSKTVALIISFFLLKIVKDAWKIFSRLFTKQFNAIQNMVRMMKTGFFEPGKYLYEYTRKHWKKLWMRFSMRLFLTICCRSMWKSSQNSFWLLFIMVLKNKHVSKQRFCFLRTSLSTSSWGRFKITRDNEATQNLQTLSISVKFCKKKCMRTNIRKHFCQFPLSFAEKRSETKFAWNIYLFCF